ncbi:MAG: PAS domain-containing sensor histidine kinase [Bacteroidetes bacterium]|nr:PAS domain-containing sensor histidine kinase [Bacteroidota bacterium]MBU1371311.1 PAS domain-containing sensor histidine kinase [Bacteroidota bacterium]MBU1485798.1 PAS domain-containing sensor histidine kinase [Bacteroidota bacterium]MBU1761582.1 PAS domain-containing sensor histidine kinase [Bacteroidota bacterium]MBU2047252.1 PAS domain-containing sensor histidine kinase [Bacteroidota bacterium]
MNDSALLTAIIENAIDGIITIDDKGIIESINPSGCRLFGYQQREVIGENISMLMPEPDRSQHDQYISRYQETRDPHIIGKGREVKGKKKNGSLFPFRLAVSEVQYEGRIIYNGFIHDLTREKNAEDQLIEYTNKLEQLVEDRTERLQSLVSELQKAKEEVSVSLEKEKELNQLKSRFVSMASHEFRTPLSSIQLSVSLIDKYSIEYHNPNIGKHVNKIKIAIGNLTTILNDFLSLERLETGIIEPQFGPIHLVKFAEEIAEEMQMVAKQNQNIIYQHTGINSMFNTDAGLLKNSIINLISNAIKYSGENTFIEFNTEITDEQCFITISDNGIGIPLSEQKHLFQAFFRAHNTGNIPGTGLGLNIVDRYVKLLNGEVEFESAENKGTKFILIFKL